jgi:hypothetical protein
MNRWMRRIVAVLEIGGSFMGILALLLAKPWARGLSPGTMTVLLVFLCLGLLGLAAGLLVAEGRRLGLWLSLLYQMVQIPVIVSAAVTYQFLPGIQIVAGRFGDFHGVLFQCQSRLTFFIGRVPDASSCGLNLSALFFFLYLAWVLGRGLIRATSSQRNVASAQTAVEDSLAVR